MVYVSEYLRLLQYRCLLYVVLNNLEPQYAGLVDVKRGLHEKSQRDFFVRENLKNKHCY